MFSKINALSAVFATFVFSMVLLMLDATDIGNPSFNDASYVVMWSTPLVVVLVSAWDADECGKSFWQVIRRGILFGALALVFALTVATGNFVEAVLFTVLFGGLMALVWLPLLAILILTGILLGKGWRYLLRRLQA